MIQTNKEYFIKPYYFFLKENKNSISLYFSVELTINEARKSDIKIDFKTSDLPKINLIIREIAKSKKKYSKDDIKKKFDSIKLKDKHELEEFINSDGTLASSKIPILDLKQHPKKTMDQTIPAARQTNDPILRGFRTYYNEGEITETDFSDAFGYEETKDMPGKQTKKQLEKMGLEPDEAKKRTKQFGKDPSGKKTQKAPDNIKNKKGFVDRMTLSEKQREKMVKMVEAILTKKYVDDYDIRPKEERAGSKILMKNIKSLKKMANREGLTVNQLFNLLKNEQ